MSSLHVKYLLIGGGLASSEAAAAIRQIDSRGDLMLVGQEISRPYHRPPLSKEFLRGQMDRSKLFTQPAEWFVENHVQLRSGRRVAHLDTSRHCATLDNAEELSFDSLLIATGGTAALLRAPGANLPNLFYLRTLNDAERLQHAAEKAKRDGRLNTLGTRGRAVVVGGGVLGVEVAGSLSRLGLQVDLALAKGHPWDRFAGETLGRFITLFLEKHGIVVHANAPVLRVEGDGRVQRTVLASGEAIDCDFSVAAVGMQVNVEILRGTPIAAERAVLVDEQCRTSLADIYAAGDCAAVFDPLFGKHRLMEHWEGAATTGKIAGTNMAGGDARYDAVSFFDSEVLGLSLGVWGEGKLVDRRVLRGTPNLETPACVELGIARDGRIVQAIALGQSGDAPLLSDLVKQRVRIEGNEEMLKDPAVPLERILKPA